MTLFPQAALDMTRAELRRWLEARARAVLQHSDDANPHDAAGLIRSSDDLIPGAGAWLAAWMIDRKPDADFSPYGEHWLCSLLYSRIIEQHASERMAKMRAENTRRKG